nr:hypothetical protein [Streptomyces sp. NRRL B-24572]
MRNDTITAGPTGVGSVRRPRIPGPILATDQLDSVRPPTRGTLHALHSREVIDLTAQSDADFDHTVFADALHRVGRHSDKQFAVYGIDPPPAVIREFAC